MYLFPVTVKNAKVPATKLHLLVIAKSLKRARELVDTQYPAKTWESSDLPKEEEIDFAMHYRHWAWEIMDTHIEEIVVLEDTTHPRGLSEGHNATNVDKNS